MQKNKILILAVIFILTVLAFYYRYSIVEIYYGITGRVVKEKISHEAIISKDFSSDVSNPENDDYYTKVICLNKVPHTNCTFIRASIPNWEEHLRERTGSIDIVCTYGCPK